MQPQHNVNPQPILLFQGVQAEGHQRCKEEEQASMAATCLDAAGLHASLLWCRDTEISVGPSSAVALLGTWCNRVTCLLVTVQSSHS